jgi:2-C-methyl-D-erythritol 4-phosphate cytidylyltransferase
MSYEGKFISAVIPAAGMGTRMEHDMNKIFIIMENRPILAHTLEAFQKCDEVDEIVVVAKEEELLYMQAEFQLEYPFSKVRTVVAGGETRQDSVFNGLMSVDPACDIVLIHDGARPFVNQRLILDSIKGVIEYGACVVGVPVKDTIKVIDPERKIRYTPQRKSLWTVQTPQSFVYEFIVDAHLRAQDEEIKATDDSSLVEQLGYQVHMVMGNYDNIKITTPEDLKFAKAILWNWK